MPGTDQAGGVLERAGLRILRHPRAVALATLLLVAVCGLSLARLRIDPNVEHLLPPGDPTLRLTRHLQGDSPATRVLFVILRGEDSASLDKALPLIAGRLRASPHLERVTATRTEFAGGRVPWIGQSILHFLPEPVLARLEERLGEAGRKAELALLRGRLAEDPLAGKATALADPLGLRWILDEASERAGDRFPARLRAGSDYLVFDSPPVAFIKAIGREDASQTRFSHALLDDVRGRLDAATAGTKVLAEPAGSYVSTVTQESALRRDMIVETIVSAIAVLFYVWWFTRSLIAAHLVFVPVLLATAGSLALGGELLGPLTPVVASAAAILIAQGIDFPMHYFCRYRVERLRLDREGALHAAQVEMARPFTGIAATTLIAFLSLLISRFPGFRQLGFVLGAGIVLCLVGALTLFPILLMPLDRRIRPAAGGVPWVVRGAEAVLKTGWRVPAAWALVVLGVAAWGCVAWKGVRMDLDLRNAMAPGDPGRAALERAEGDLGAALIPVFALVDSTIGPDDLGARLAALREAGTLAAADGLPSLVPSAKARERVSGFRERTRGWVDATLSDLKALGFSPEPFRKGLNDMEALFAAPPPKEADLERPAFADLRRAARYEVDGRPVHVLTLFAKRSLWEPEARREFDRAVRARLGETAALYSPFHLPDHYSSVLTGDLGRVILITSVGIVLLTLASVGGLRDGLLALFPVVLATGMTLAAAVLLGGTINVINMAAVPIILAVGVDGGIHYMVRFRQDGRRDPAGTIRDVGPGIYGSAVTTLLGFGSIAYSLTPGMSSMGLLVVVGTITSLVASLFLLPGLLHRGDPGGGLSGPGRRV